MIQCFLFLGMLFVFVISAYASQQQSDWCSIFDRIEASISVIQNSPEYLALNQVDPKYRKDDITEYQWQIIQTVVYDKLGESDKALSIASEALSNMSIDPEREPDELRAYLLYFYGKLLEETKSLESQPIELLTNIINNPTAMELQAQALYRLIGPLDTFDSKEKEAKFGKYWAFAYSIDPEDVILNSAIQLYLLGGFEASRNGFRSLDVNYTGFKSEYVKMMLYLNSLNLNDEASADDYFSQFESIVSENPLTSSTSLESISNRIFVARSNKQDENVSMLCTFVLKHYPGSANAPNYLYYCLESLYNLEKDADAIALYEDVWPHFLSNNINLNPGLNYGIALMHYMLAKVYLRSEQKECGIQALSRARYWIEKRPVVHEREILTLDFGIEEVAANYGLNHELKLRKANGSGAELTTIH